MDREPGVAIYRQIADELRSEIEEGLYPVGGLLPSQAALAERFDAAVATIRTALRLLQEWGLTTPRQGRGVYVKARQPEE